MVEKEYDVVIVGASITGSIVARQLSEATDKFRSCSGRSLRSLVRKPELAMTKSFGVARRAR